jgi:hypothetical protein
MTDAPPSVLQTIRDLASLDDAARIAAFRRLSAAEKIAAKLWIYAQRERFDPQGRLGAMVEALWQTHGGKDAYWDVLGERDRCGECGQTFRLENLAICPNCFRLSCYRHRHTCACGHTPVG